MTQHDAGDTAITSSTAAIGISDLSKNYGATRALKHVDLNLESGRVHALVGENGAGKSTLLGILAGRTSASSGSVAIHGKSVSTGNPRAARRAGVAAVYQELTIVPHLSAEANVFLGRARSNWGVLNERAMRSAYVELCESLGIEAWPGREARSLSLAQRQMLEILRAVSTDANVIMLDEPSAALAAAEQQVLLDTIKTLRARGTTLVLVTHNLDEVFAAADTITVFRDGALVEKKEATAWTRRTLVAAMLDRRVSSIVSAERPVAPPHGDEVLKAENVTVPGRLEPLSISVAAGEVLGIGGLVGSGRSTLLRALAGLEPTSSGSLALNGTSVKWPKNVRRALGLGIALVPEDRKNSGLVLQLSAQENIVLSDMTSVSSAGLVSNARSTAAATEAARAATVDTNRLRTRAQNLSGGNQQKLMMARWFHRPPLVLLADEPYRGIDIGAKSQITDALRRMAEDGRAVIVVSSELEDVTTIADRILVLAHGSLVGELNSNDRSASVEDILELAFSVGEKA